MKYSFFIFYVCLLYAMSSASDDCCGAKTLTFKYIGRKWRPDGYNQSYCDDFGATLVGHRYNLYTEVVCEIRVCGDGYPFTGAHCSIGYCNVFGCNCEAGCIPGDAVESFRKRFSGKVYDVKLQPLA